MYKDLLLAFNGTDLARRALTTAVELARRLNVVLKVVVIDESIPTPVLGAAFAASDSRVIEDAMAIEDRRNSALAAEVQQAADAAGIQVEIDVVQGDEVAAISDAVARHGCDLLIVGLRPRPGFVERLTQGSAADRAPCSVLAVR